MAAPRRRRNRALRPAGVVIVMGLQLLLAMMMMMMTTLVAEAFVRPPAPAAATRRSRSSGRRLLAAPAAGSSSKANAGDGLLTREEIEACAADFGIELKLTTLGPFYRVIARLKGQAETAEPMGYTEGFVVPLLGLVHLDTMQVRRRYWKQLQRDGARQFRFGVRGLAWLGYSWLCGWVDRVLY